MISNRLVNVSITICCCLLAAVDAFAYTPSELKTVRIELHYDLPEVRNEIGATHTKTLVPYTYFMLTDLYTDEEIKIKSDSYKDAVTVFEFELNHPLYDCIISGGNVKIPFYVNPGDTLIINLAKNGKVLSYKTKDGKDVQYKNLLLHDFSNNVLYTDKQYDEDRKDATFPVFIQRVTKRMHHSLDSLDLVAKKYGFTIEERQIASDNIMIQYGKWMFQFAPYRPKNANNYSAGNVQDNDITDIADVGNYSFYRQLPFDDSLCVASRYFPRFMNSYEHTYFLNSDKEEYNGTSLHDQARMDSAFVSKDMQITELKFPSFFMEMAMIRRHFDSSAVDDGSVRLHEVKVIGHQNTYYKPVTTEDMIKWRDNQKPTTAEQVASPSYWLFERKKYLSKKRAKALIEKIAAEDDPKSEERDALLKAYEEETGHKYDEGSGK